MTVISASISTSIFSICFNLLYHPPPSVDSATNRRLSFCLLNPVWKVIPAPLGARAYPWILSKYFLCVRACVHLCVCPPTDKHRGCIFCVKTLNLCGISVVFCSYLEYNAITPFSSHVLYRFLHTYFFCCPEVLSM